MRISQNCEACKFLSENLYLHSGYNYVQDWLLTSFFCSSSFFLISASFLCFKAACHGGIFGLSSTGPVDVAVFARRMSVFVLVLEAVSVISVLVL